MRPGIWQVVIVVLVVFVLFGAKKIPELARSLGKAKGEFKKGLAEGERVRVGAYNGKWACVRVDGVTGYMPVEDLELTSDEGSAEDSGVNYLECYAVTTAPTQLFGSADLTGEAIMPLEQGVVVHVYAFDSHSAYVEIDGRRGFVALRWLKKLS